MISGFFRKRLSLTVILLVVIILSFTAHAVFAANPIITNRFVADPAAYVFNNRVYVYFTDDQTNSGTFWDSKNWRAYSSSDLTNWTDHGQIFAVGSGGFSWASNYAWAPAAAQRNGYYYLYLPVDSANSGSIAKIGVARSTSPTSGFVDALGSPLIQEGRDANTGSEAIDPMVFIDDDGQAYLYFGGMNQLRVVKLNSDMIHLSGAIQSMTASNYAEAPWVHKRNGIYYLSYSTGWPGQIGYSTSSSPLGPWTYKGIVLDFVNTNTNHQAIINYNSRWFLFYHKNAMSGGSNYKRSPTIDCLYYNTDNTMKMVTQTSAGVTSTGCNAATTTYYRITNRNSSKVIDVQQPNTSDGAKIGQWTWNSSNWQQWEFQDAGGGYFRIISRHSGKCLDVNGASTADGAGIIQWACGTGTNQQWQWAATGSYFNLKARHSGKCINVVGSSTTDGALLEQRTCGTGNSFQWSRQ